jgi:hypothetical protein
MGDIKSAREIAMEKIAGIGEATEEERLEWRMVPEGEKLGARYFKENLNLVTELGRYDEKARKYVAQALSKILVRNIDMPKNELARKNNRRAMEGLKNIKSDKAAVENEFSKIRRLFEHYTENGEQQKKQAYQSLKNDFTAKMQQAVQQQLGTAANFKIDVERQPQFQEEWMRLQSQLDMQYVKLLDEYKQEILNIS